MNITVWKGHFITVSEEYFMAFIKENFITIRNVHGNIASKVCYITVSKMY